MSIDDELGALDQAIAALEAQRSVLGDGVVDTALEPLLLKRRHLNPGAEQRKLVTVLFADLVEFSVFSQQLDPEDTRAVVNRYFNAWRRAIEGEGGTVEKFIGDAVMAVFGLHRANEDDPHRAIRAALTMRESLEEMAAEVRDRHGVRLEMRVGIDTGEVVVSTLGDRGDGEFVVVGESVNRAARFQSVAPEGGILISAETFGHVRGSFGFQRMSDLKLKGIERPVDGYLVVTGQVQSFWPETRGIEGVTTRTVGRDLEMARLQRLFHEHEEEESWRFVTVMGEAGIGKSRLIHDFENWLAELPEGVWVFRGRAAPTADDTPHGVLKSAFAERLQIQDTDRPEAVREKWRNGLARFLPEQARNSGADLLASWLGFFLGEEAEPTTGRTDPELLQRQARAALIELLATMAKDAPVVILLEDLHWGDATTLGWLEELAAQPPRFPLLVIASARPSLLERRPHWGEGLDSHTAIRLEPLSRRESRSLVADILQRMPELPEDLGAVVVGAAEGNPFFIEELVKWLIDQGVIDTRADSWRLADSGFEAARVPATLRGVLQARLDSLGRADRDLLERAAVVGRVFWDEAVASLAAGEAAPAADAESYERLRSREVVFRRPTSTFENANEFSFRHALLRDVAYEGVLRSRRRHYHALAARWFQDVIERTGRSHEHAGILGYHLEEAGEEEEAARCYLRAGLHAADTFANDSALSLLEAAARCAAGAGGDLRFDILAAQEGVLDRVGLRDHQRQVLDAMASMETVDTPRRAEALLAEGRWKFFHAEYESAVTFAERSADLAAGVGRPDLELDGRLLAGRSMAFRSDHRAAREYLEGVLAAARQAGSRRHEAACLHLLGIVATNLAESDVAVARLDEAATAFRQLGDLEGEGLATGQLGAVLITLERHEEARRQLETSLGIFVATGHRLRQSIILGNLVALTLEQGRLDDALSRGRETLELAESLGDPEGIVSSLHRMGEIARFTGEKEAARGYLERGIALEQGFELHYFRSFILASLVALDLDAGDTAAAARNAEMAIEAADRSEVPHPIARSRLVRGIVQLRQGKAADAVATLTTAVDLHRELDSSSETLECEATLAAALMEAGRLAEATVLARRCLEALEAGTTPGTYQPGQAILDCHRVLESAGVRDAVRTAAVGHEYLRARSALISDPMLRTRFLCDSLNQQLAALGRPSPPPG